MEDQKKSAELCEEAYCALLIRKINERNELISVQDIKKIDKALDLVIIDPYMRIQKMQSHLKDVKFFHIMPKKPSKMDRRTERLGQPKCKRLCTEAERASPKLFSSAALNNNDYQCMQRHLKSEDMYRREIEKNKWVLEELKKETSVPRGPHTLYLLLVETEELFLPISLC
ncbi:uncharacterized protein NEMAJ01_0376 [Nematocida major]|uniref:uncharacterized protein n=1 Tax=Nematocida major TaxID=1912982 RepID=UPI0020072E0F|nr:uncharacterized protein NEMAJ01_0376 [Nematocida major]KAH9385480.1 hypothetical protein NEMAJ01_0376 [Nematocida major]